jgi:putative lipoic acid-binding regulatory protein
MYSSNRSQEAKVEILDDNTQDKPKIDYPISWGFKIIGKDKNELLSCIKEIMGNKKHLCHIGNSSSGGKFHTYNANCEVESEEERNKIFKAFSDHDAVKMVI